MAPATQAAPNQNIVTIGDSFTANPDQVHNTFRVIPGLTDGYPETGGCLQAPNNWARKVGEKNGSSHQRLVLHRYHFTVSAGDLHSGTRSVVLAVGMNYYGGFGVLDGANILDPAAVRNAYLQDIGAAAKIRSIAPSAKIIIAGELPTIERGTMVFCAINVISNMPGGIPIPVLRDVENWNQDNQREAAHLIGGEYVEIIDGARGHDTCAPDYNMIFHPSNAGSEYIARSVAARV